MQGRVSECYSDEEPTEEQLEAIIAEQLKCLPQWFKDEQERRQAADVYQNSLEPVLGIRAAPVRVANRKRPLTA